MKYVIEYGLWEVDFILNDILPPGKVLYVKTENVNNLNSYCDVFVFSCRVHDFWDIKNVIQKIKPKIVIMVADEFELEHKWNYNMIGQYCDLFLRQYHHSFYNYTPNTFHIPLGYTNECKSFTSEKIYDWSFIGEIKTDRQEMIDQFSKFGKNFIGDKIPKEKMCEIYSQSIFVPCGRGNASLDCFRLYEASMNGAIPVIVGSKKEIECTFKYEENPPWIFAETWEDAVDKSKYFLDTGISNIDVLTWWKSRVQKIKNKVLEVL